MDLKFNIGTYMKMNKCLFSKTRLGWTQTTWITR